MEDTSFKKISMLCLRRNTMLVLGRKPGEKIILSPPSDNSMQFVMINADNDIFVSKAYRELPKMVGMMGS